MKKIISILLICAFVVLTKQVNSQNLIWAKHMGGSSNAIGNSVTMDAIGNIYTTGVFSGTADFDPSPSTFNLSSAGYYDIFVSKLDASGNFLWAKQMGGSDYEAGLSIAVAANGDVYTTGYFWGTADFDPGSGKQNLTSSGLGDIFISNLDASGNFKWVKQLGAAKYDICNAITLDVNGNIFLTGSFAGMVDFNPGPGVFNMTSTIGSSDDDIFILKLNAAGDFTWAKRMENGGDRDAGLSIKVDVAGNVYTCGYFRSGIDFDPGPGVFYISLVDKSDIFVSKLDASGNFKWAKAMAGTGEEQANGIFLDRSGNVYTTGAFERTVDFDPGPGIYNLTVDSLTDIFVSKLDSLGNFKWAKKMGGKDDETSLSIALDLAGNVYTTGNFSGIADFDPDAGTFNLSSTKYTKTWAVDIFISKLDSLGNFVWAKKISGGTSQIGHSIMSDASENVFLTGEFYGTADFDPGSGTYNLVSGTQRDVFVVKLGAEVGLVKKIISPVKISIYPNPNPNILTIESPTIVNIKLSDTGGRMILEQKNIQQINLENYPSGTYILMITDQENNVLTVEKIIKMD